MTEVPESAAAPRACNVCASRFEQPIYLSEGAISVTSLCQLYEGRTEVYFCRICGHVQTAEIERIAEYYDRDYRILIDSEEEDQLYEVSNGTIIYRTDHQVRTLLSKVSLPHGARVLDYGCAKAATLRKLVGIRADINPHLFDVSRMYMPFWRKFVPEDSWAVYETPQHWNERFDLVTSFFALEHVADPAASLRTMTGLLKPGGQLYGIVPNLFTNRADLVVVDHINHYTRPSLEKVLADSGLHPLDIDDQVHIGAFVFRAKRPQEMRGLTRRGNDVLRTHDDVVLLAQFWRVLGSRVRDFESSLAPDRQVAIYGSGFYGTFIASALRDFERVECFLDRNPYRQGKTLLGKPIVPPAEIPEQIHAIYIGLNPAGARESIADLHWEARNYQFFFI